MRAGVIEIVGLFVIIAGCCTLVGAAALVSTALAVAVAGAFLLLAGVLAVYVANRLDAAAPTPAEPRSRDS